MEGGLKAERWTCFNFPGTHWKVGISRLIQFYPAAAELSQLPVYLFNPVLIHPFTHLHFCSPASPLSVFFSLLWDGEAEQFLRVLLQCRSRMGPFLISFPLLPSDSALFFYCLPSQITSLFGVQISLTFLQVQLSWVHPPLAQGQSLWVPAIPSLRCLLLSLPELCSPAPLQGQWAMKSSFLIPNRAAGWELPTAPTLDWIDSSTARNPSGCARTKWGEQERLCQSSPAWPALGAAWGSVVVITTKAQTAQLPPLVQKSPQREEEKQELYGTTCLETVYRWRMGKRGTLMSSPLNYLEIISFSSIFNPMQILT